MNITFFFAEKAKEYNENSLTERITFSINLAEGPEDSPIKMDTTQESMNPLMETQKIDDIHKQEDRICTEQKKEDKKRCRNMKAINKQRRNSGQDYISPISGTFIPSRKQLTDKCQKIHVRTGNYLAMISRINKD